MRADEIHSRLASSWPQVLVQLGIAETTLKNKHGPCPACGGKDRFRFDNKRGRGDYFCNHCGAGDGFKLLERTFGWTFSMARRHVIAAAGLADDADASPAPVSTRIPAHVPATPEIAQPTARVHRLRSDRCAIENCDDAVDYLDSRRLWPPPPGCSLRAHATVEYWNDNVRVGRYPALVADVLDVAGELVTVHTTYLQHGKKLAGHEPRKIWSPMTGRRGCAVRLMPVGAVMGIAEGIETALSATELHDVPTWAALNTSLLAKFEPPATVRRLLIFADADVPGLQAAAALMQRLQGRVELEIRTPPAPAKDWNDALMTHNSRRSGEGFAHE